MTVSFTTAAGLVHQLMEARDEKRLLRLQSQLAACKLLIVDELGYVPLSPTGAELLFEVFSQRYERGSTIVTSNLPFEEWTSVFGVMLKACLRHDTAHRRVARPSDASRSYPGTERRELPAEAVEKPEAERSRASQRQRFARRDPRSENGRDHLLMIIGPAPKSKKPPSRRGLFASCTCLATGLLLLRHGGRKFLRH